MDNSPVIDALRRLAGPGPDDVSDTDLLARFVASHDGAAFEALVRRHGRLVWGACRRRLSDLHAAEDAFQTTFLALARHAAEVRRPDALGAWLHRVAVRCTTAFRTPRYHMPLSSLEIAARGTDPADAASARDLEQLIDCEIDALPEPYRLAFVLCEVEQRTAADAAKTLGCPVGTVESRLTRARQWLRARLTRRGITVGTLAGAALVADSVPATARAGTVALVSGSQPAPAALVSVADRAVRLGLRGLAIGAGLAGGLGVVGLGGLIWVLTLAPRPAAPVVEPPSAAASNELPIPQTEQFRRNRGNFPLPPEAVARLGDPWLRHGAIPQRMAFSGDGRLLATGGAGDRWLRVWDLATSRPRAHLRLADGESPVALGLTADGRTLRAVVCTGDARTAHLREYDTYRGLETRRRLLAGAPITVSAFSQNGRLLATASGGRIRMLDATTAAELWRADVSAAAQRVELAFAANGKRLATVADGSDRAQIFDTDTGQIRDEIVESGAALSLPSVSADSRRLAAWCSQTQRVKVWDVSARELVCSVKPRSPVSGLLIAPDGGAVAVFSSNRAPTLWPVDSQGEGRVLGGVVGGMSGRFSPDGTVLAVASPLMAVQLAPIQADAAVPPSPGNVMPLCPVAFAGDGRRLLAECMQLWVDYPLRDNDPPTAFGPWQGPHQKSALSPDRSLIARCTDAGNDAVRFGIDLLDATTRRPRGRIELDQAAFRPAFSPDGKVLFAVTRDGHVRGWDVATRRHVMQSAASMTEDVGTCTAHLTVSPDSRYVAFARRVFFKTGSTDSIRVFDAATGEQKFALDGARGEPRVAFSADGRWFAAATGVRRGESLEPMLAVCAASTGRIKFGIPGLDGQPAFSPDGRTVAVTHDRGVVLIELATGQVRHEFHHHGKVEPALAWRPDGRMLAAASPEAPMYLWDVVGDRTGIVPEWDPAHDETRWSGLCASDAAAAFQSLRQLWSHPSEAVAFLKSRIAAGADARLASRVCEALELIATPEARALLASWAAAEPANPLSAEASGSLKRMLRT